MKTQSNKKTTALLISLLGIFLAIFPSSAAAQQAHQAKMQLIAMTYDYEMSELKDISPNPELEAWMLDSFFWKTTSENYQLESWMIDLSYWEMETENYPLEDWMVEGNKWENIHYKSESENFPLEDWMYEDGFWQIEEDTLQVNSESENYPLEDWMFHITETFEYSFLYSDESMQAWADLNDDFIL